MKRQVAWLLLVFSLAGCSQRKPTHETSAVPVRLSSIELYRPVLGERYSASILPNRQVNLSFKTGGLVESLDQIRGADGLTRSVDLGDVVQRGTELARVRTQDYRLQVSQVQGQVQQARAAEQTAGAQLAQVQAAAVKAEDDFERADSLYKKNSLTKSDYDAAKANRDSTRAQVEAASSQHQASAGGLSASEAMLGSAKLALQDTCLVAPFTGVIVQRSIDIGSLSGPSTIAFVLADISSVKATFAVSDIALAGFRRGSKIAVYSEAMPGRSFSGYVSAIAPVADSNTRSFQVEVTISNQGGILRPGMVTSLNGGNPKGAAMVALAPLNAIIPGENGPGQFAVLAVVGGVARRMPVALGATYGDRIAVTGVAVGQKVVSSGAAFASDGEPVTVIP